MGCQTAIAEKILARGGDLLTLKGNHPLAHAAVVSTDQHCFGRDASARGCESSTEARSGGLDHRAFSTASTRQPTTMP